MRFKIKIKYAVIAAVNCAAIIGASVMTAVGGHMARSQQYNYAWERWGGECVQVSSFFSDDSGFNVNGVELARFSLMESLRSVSEVSGEKKVLFPDAYSAPIGKAEVTCDIKGRSEAEVTAVGGNFFMFRSFRLLDGAFFREDDLMHDGAVIDRDLAWSLYGSDMISGKNIYINGVKLYISGVIDTPQTDAELSAIGSSPKAYVSYEYAARIAEASSAQGAMFRADEVTPDTSGETRFTKVTCYECIMPDPVEDFGYSSVKNAFGETYRGKVDIVNNTTRFEPKKCAKAYKRLEKYAIRDDAVVYPYWENASRLVAFRLSGIYHTRKQMLTVPTVTLAWLVFLAARKFRRIKPKLKRKVGRAVGRKYEKLRATFWKRIKKRGIPPSKK